MPTEPARKEERLADRLQDKSGSDFDKAFAEPAIKDHEKDIQKYEKALQNSKDADRKAYLEKSLPVLYRDELCRELYRDSDRVTSSAIGIGQAADAEALAAFWRSALG